MKRFMTILLVLSMVLCLVPAFAVSADSDIVIDGDLSDWEGIKSLTLAGSGDHEGKGATWYGKLTNEGLYLACDAYHSKFITSSANWWESSNFEFFLRYPQQVQGWVSARNIDGTAPTDTNNVTESIMVNEAVTKGAASQHTITEVFISNDIMGNMVYADAIRVGIAWKTVQDICNNGGTNADGSDWWTPAGAHPQGDQKTVITADGMYTVAEYRAANETKTVDLFGTGGAWKYQTGTWNGADPAAPEGWPNSIANTMLDGTAPLADEWATNENPNDGTQTNAYLWTAKEITIDDLDAIKGLALFANLRYDDDIKLYVNGTLVYENGNWNDGYVSYKIADDAADLLVEGKNIIAASLHQHFGGFDFDMGLYAQDASKTTILTDYATLIPASVDVATADELLDYIATANYVSAIANKATKGKTLNITADIDVSGKNWQPLTHWVGMLEGNGHTISGIEYTTGKTGSIGLIVNENTNDNANGTVQNLTVADSVLIAKSSSQAGAIAGHSDRGRVINCTVEGVTVIGKEYVGGIVGRVSWQSNDPYTLVENCKIVNSTVIATLAGEAGLSGYAGALVGVVDNTIAQLGTYVVEDVILKAGSANITVAYNPDSAVAGEDSTSAGVVIYNTLDIEVSEDSDSSFDGSAAEDINIETQIAPSAITAVKIDGKEVDVTIDVVDGKTVITIPKAYLATLANADYTIVVESYEGNIEADLTISNNTPAPGTEEGPGTEEEPNTKTGDAAIALVLVAVLSLGAVAVVSKKRISAR